MTPEEKALEVLRKLTEKQAGDRPTAIRFVREGKWEVLDRYALPLGNIFVDTDRLGRLRGRFVKNKDKS